MSFVCVSIMVRFYVCEWFFSLLTEETDWWGFEGEWAGYGAAREGQVGVGEKGGLALLL